MPSPKVQVAVNAPAETSEVFWKINSSPSCSYANDATHISEPRRSLSQNVSVHPLLSIIVRQTSYNIASGKVCVGFCSVEVVPSPKFQFHEAILPRLLSVNTT